MFDEDFVTALEHGLPPTADWASGRSIDDVFDQFKFNQGCHSVSYDASQGVMLVDLGKLKKGRRAEKRDRKHNYYYYVLDSPVITDEEYDALYRELVELERRFRKL